MRTATKEDFKVGNTLLDIDNNRFEIIEDLNDGMYEALNNDKRNGKVVHDSDARFYRVA